MCESTSKASSTGSTSRASTTSIDAQRSGLDSYIVRPLVSTRRRADEVDWTRWSKVLQAVHNPKHEVTIGPRRQVPRSARRYLSVTEALKAGGFAQETKVNIR